MSKWIVKKEFDKLPKLKNPLLIEGLPGMGSVGKIALDFIVDELKPKVLYKIYSYSFPHSVYLTTKSTVELPNVRLYYYKGKKSSRDLLILGGDTQPTDEKNSYEFADKVLDLIEPFDCKDVLTLGGIGLPNEVKKSKLFGAVTCDKALEQYKKTSKKIDFKANKKVEAIFGASGLLLGLANLRGVKGMALLAETHVNPAHLGFKEARVMLAELKKMLGLELNMKTLDKDIQNLENEKSKLLKQLGKEKIAGEIQNDLDAPRIGYIG
jgi:uncharacterized protein (TIGR00162 family)